MCCGKKINKNQCGCNCNQCVTCEVYKPPCPPDPCNDCVECESDKGCPIDLDTSCVFYNLTRQESSKLTCLNLGNGTSLSTILEELDKRICAINPYNFSGYDLSCLFPKYTITNFKEFAESVDKELCSIRKFSNDNTVAINASIASTNQAVLNINFPNVSDCASIGILPSDNISTILQKFGNKICSIASTCCGDNSPSILATDSSTISFLTSGAKNHNITSSVKISGVSGNLLKINPDGLYATFNLPSFTQNLTYSNVTGQLCLTNGGNCVNLPLPQNQVLGFDCLTGILSISSGNTVNLSCLASSGGTLSETSLLAIDTPTIDFTTSGTSNHIITGNVIIDGLISTTAGNSIINNGGLYLSDELIKTRAIDPTAGYLEDKIVGLINSLISTTTTTNVSTNKIEVNSVLDVNALLNVINSNTTFKAALCNIVESCMCYTFRVNNISATASTYSYVDCSGITHSSQPIPANTFLDICGRSITTPSGDVIISNLGNC